MEYWKRLYIFVKHINTNIMKKVLLAIENDASFERANYTKFFMSKFDGEIIDMSNFHRFTRDEIVVNVSKCTDIATQSCFINGSENQLASMVTLLSKMPHSINVYIRYIGGHDENALYELFCDMFSPKKLMSIEKHKIYLMSPNHHEWEVSDYDNEHKLLDFSPIVDKLKAEIKAIEDYKNSALERKTGRKIKILGCTAHGKAFENLPIGEIVDELECADLSTGKPRGVWIMGNGEPIMLVNDHGFNEYTIVTKLSIEEILDEIDKTTDLSINELKPLEIEGILSLISDKELDVTSKANIICEETNIEKRYNRQKIATLLLNNLVD